MNVDSDNKWTCSQFITSSRYASYYDALRYTMNMIEIDCVTAYDLHILRRYIVEVTQYFEFNDTTIFEITDKFGNKAKVTLKPDADENETLVSEFDRFKFDQCHSVIDLAYVLKIAIEKYFTEDHALYIEAFDTPKIVLIE